VGSGHSAHLHVDGASRLHSLPPHVKLVGLLAFVLAVVSVPEEAPVVLGGLVAVSGMVLLSTGVAPRHLAPRLVVALPVVVFALVLPFVASGPDRELGPLTVSVAGLSAAWAVLAKGLIGVCSAVAFAVTTHPPDLVAALQRLRTPALVVLVLSFMVRYLGVVTDELSRMRVARESRASAGAGPAPGRCWRRAPVPSSSAATRGVSGCISRCSAGASPGSYR
jgi:cobalt/nickel transport system permease protein